MPLQDLDCEILSWARMRSMTQALNPIKELLCGFAPPIPYRITKIVQKIGKNAFIDALDGTLMLAIHGGHTTSR